MSLLMDALRKAEQAKRRAESASNSGLQPSIELESAPSDLAGRPPVPPAGPPLPELPSTLELLDDQFGNVTDAPAAATPRIPGAPPGKPAAEQLARERQAAQQVFAAKAPPPPSRRGFYIGLGAATLVAVAGVGGYFWWQLQPRSTLLVAAPGSRPPLQQTAPAVAGTPASAPRQVPGSAASGGSAVASAAPSAGNASAQDIESAGQSEMPVARPSRPPRPAVQRGQFADAPVLTTVAAETSVRVSRSRPQVDAGVERGYRHFQSGDLAAARSDYEQVLRRAPHNTDALNGLAAIALRNGDPQAAESYYQRTLEADPQDATALASLVGLRGKADPVQAESRLKMLAASQPDSHATHFALGNLYAGQGRWNEAQQAYFRAYSGEPDNPDYHFNLAVSLDQLRQSRLALQYYQSALNAAATRPAAFDATQASARVRELQSAAQ